MLRIISIYFLVTNLLLISCMKKNPALPDTLSFYNAIRENDIGKVKRYLRRYNNISNVLLGNGPLGMRGTTHASPIMMAVYNNKEGTEILDLLVKNGGNIHYVNEDGNNAIIYAVLFDNAKALIYLIEKGGM